MAFRMLEILSLNGPHDLLGADALSPAIFGLAPGGTGLSFGLTVSERITGSGISCSEVGGVIGAGLGGRGARGFKGVRGTGVIRSETGTLTGGVGCVVLRINGSTSGGTGRVAGAGGTGGVFGGTCAGGGGVGVGVTETDGITEIGGMIFDGGSSLVSGASRSSSGNAGIALCDTGIAGGIIFISSGFGNGTLPCRGSCCLDASPWPVFPVSSAIII